MERSMAICEFVSASTAGIVHVELGFVPDYVELISDHGGTPKVMKWLNTAKYPNFPASRTVQIVGGSTAFSADANTYIQPYAGGDRITSDETANTAGKHVKLDGSFALTGHMTRAGISIAAAAQVNSGRNIVLAFRGDK